MDSQTETIRVEVVYALPERQSLLQFEVQSPCTALEAVMQSGILDIYPEIDPQSTPMGIFSRPLDGKQLPSPADYVLKDKDRVEIYRPLLLSPQEARILRAERAKAKRVAGGKTKDST